MEQSYLSAFVGVINFIKVFAKYIFKVTGKK
jgi:hypothetical protein